MVLVASILGATIGLLPGYFAFRALVYKLTQLRLDEYSVQLLTDSEASASELRTVLTAISSSTDRPCSDLEIIYFRALIFEHEYAKDVGRIENNRIICSAASGHHLKTLDQARPDFIQQDGTSIYSNPGVYQDPNFSVNMLQKDNVFVVFNPLTRMHLEPAPMHFTETLIDAPTLKSGQLLGDPLQADPALLRTEGQGRLGDKLYATRCSIRYFNCFTAYASFPEVLRTGQNHPALFLFLGSSCGALFGLLLSLLYRRNQGIEQQLRRAIRADRLCVFYQPIVSLHNEKIVAAEALVRWSNEDGVAVAPDVFVKIAEERGFIGDLTKLVVRHVLRDFATVFRAQPDFHVSVNITVSDLTDPAFLPMLERSLALTSVQPCSLAIEITESSTARHEMAMETIRLLRSRGHAVHIDDFGTGYSSLAYLHDLDVEAIKIDRAFTMAIGTEAVTVSILPQILAMAKTLDLQVIVEGIEFRQQADYFLATDRPVLAQGWLFGRPMPATDFLRLLASPNLPPSPAPRAC